MVVTFDGSNKYIVLESGKTSYDAQEELYEPWKDWVHSGEGAKYFKAFRYIGGDVIDATRKAGSTLFLANGWKLLPPAEDINILIDGNLFVDESATYGINRWVQPVSGDVGMEFNVSNLIDTVTSSGDANAIAQAVWNFDVGGYEDSTTNQKAGTLLNEVNLALIQKFFIDQDKLTPINSRVTKIQLYRRDQSLYMSATIVDKDGNATILQGTVPTDRGEPLYIPP